MAAWDRIECIYFNYCRSDNDGNNGKFILFYGKTNRKRHFKINSAIGHTGTVYLRIPAAKSGVGKIQINVSGLKTLDAVTNHTEDIKSGSLIKVVDVNEGNILVVEPL
jgi:hypothetical protein